MRSPFSSISAVTDWQAANIALGIGVLPGAGNGARQVQKAIGWYGFAGEVNYLAASSVLTPFIALLRQHPEATHIKVEQRFRWEESENAGQQWRNATAGRAILTIPGRDEVVIEDRKWPAAVDPNDWVLISSEDDRIWFTLAQDDVKAFTLNGVTALTPLAEIVLQEHTMSLEPCYAAEHVRSSFGEARVAQGRPPQRWGVPGLRLIDAYLERGGNPSAMDATGATPLAVALYLRQSQVVRKLVDAGADINALAAGGLYPVDVAVLSGDAGMVRLCGELGASANTPGYLQPMLRAVDMRSPEIFEALADLGGDMDAETPDGITLSQYVEDTSEYYRERFLAMVTAKTIERAVDSSAVEGSGVARRHSAAIGMSL